MPEGRSKGSSSPTSAIPTSYLLYGGRWFPMVGYQTDRFTADIHVKVPDRLRGDRQRSAGPRQTGQQRRERVRLQLEEAGLSGHDHRREVQPASLAGAEYSRLHNRRAQGRGARLRAEHAAHLRLLHVDLRAAGVEHDQCRRAARRYRAGVLGSGDRGGGRRAHRRQDGLPAAGEHDRASVVGQRDQPGHAERCVDHERDVALRRADVSGRRRRARPRWTRRFSMFPPARWPTTPSRSRARAG